MEKYSLLESYIKEIISEIKFDKHSILGKFLKKQYKSVEKAIEKALDAKLSKLIPNELPNNTSIILATLIDNRITEIETIRQKSLTKKEKERIVDFATKVFEKSLEKYDNDVRKSLNATRYALNSFRYEN